MKIAFAFLLVASCAQASAQTYPTNAEVYNFAVGDTLVYQVAGDINLQYKSFEMMVVIGRQDGVDSIIYTLKHCFGLDSLHNYLYNDTVLQVIDSTNSTVSCYNSYYPMANECFCNWGGIGGPNYESTSWGDSSLYFGGMCVNAGGGSWNVYAVRGLGVVYINSFCVSLGDPPQQAQYCNLVYYHLTNGLIGGDSAYYISGFTDLPNTKNAVQVLPNPAYDQFTIKIEPSLQEEADFILFDALGHMVLNRKLVISSTTIQRQKLNNGIYFWRVDISGQTMQTGNLVLE